MMNKIETNVPAQVILSRADCEKIKQRLLYCQQIINHLADQAFTYKIGCGLLAAWSIAVTGDHFLSSTCQSTIKMCSSCFAEGGLPSIPGSVVCGLSEGFQYVSKPAACLIPWAVSHYLVGNFILTRLAKALAEPKQQPSEAVVSEQASISSPEKEKI